jgi:hypothetical protein
VIDAATSADILAPLIAKLPDGPLKERAKARAEALKNFPVANLPPVPPQPSPSGPCDVLVDENSNANAVLAKDIDAGLQACEAAVAGHPDELRFARLLQVAQEQRAFQRAFRSPDRGPSEAYLTLYPSGRFADDVKRHLAGLSVAPSPPVPSNPPPEPPKPKIDPVDFARMLQAELKRVGCYPVAIDGNWGASSEQALAQFNQHTHNSFDVKVASLEAIEAVRSTAGRVCPLTCGPGERVSGERCAPIDCGQGRHLSGSVCISDNRKIPRPRSSAAARSNCFAFNGDKYCD